MEMLLLLKFSYGFAGWLADCWLAGWLAGWLAAGWLVNWLAGCWMADWLAGCWLAVLLGLAGLAELAGLNGLEIHRGLILYIPCSVSTIKSLRAKTEIDPQIHRRLIVYRSS